MPAHLQRLTPDLHSDTEADRKSAYSKLKAFAQDGHVTSSVDLYVNGKWQIEIEETGHTALSYARVSWPGHPDRYVSPLLFPSTFLKRTCLFRNFAVFALDKWAPNNPRGQPSSRGCKAALEFLRDHNFLPLRCSRRHRIDLQLWVKPKRIWWTHPPPPSGAYAIPELQKLYRALESAARDRPSVSLGELLGDLGSHQVYNVMERDGTSYWRFLPDDAPPKFVTLSLFLFSFPRLTLFLLGWVSPSSLFHPGGTIRSFRLAFPRSRPRTDRSSRLTSPR